MEVPHVLELHGSNLNVLQDLVLNVQECSNQYVELIGRLIEIIAWLHVRGFLLIVTTDVLVVLEEHTQNGVNGVNGVIAKKGDSTEQEAVTSKHIVMEVYRVLGNQLTTVDARDLK